MAMPRNQTWKPQNAIFSHLILRKRSAARSKTLSLPVEDVPNVGDSGLGNSPASSEFCSKMATCNVIMTMACKHAVAT